MNTKMGGTYTSNQTDDVSLQIEWQKSADVSTIKIDRNENEILDAIIGPRYVYIKDYADNKWWREQKNIVENSLVELPFNPELFFTKLQTMLNNEETAYTYIEDIACGDEQCHRYQVTSANQKEGEQLFVFFSTTDFKLRSIFMVEDTSTGELNVVHKEVSIIEPENIKIVSSGRNIFAEYIELKDKEEQKNFEYLQQFQQQRLESEGTGTIPYVEDEATEEAVFFP